MQLRAAIVGAGPSGFYAADALLRRDSAVTVDLFDRLPTPYGLVRSGVAPDHQKIKSVAAVFAEIAGQDRVRFHGHVTVGADVTIDELLDHYHCVIVASGAGRARALGIPGEHLPGVHSALDFVGWYNGSPDHRAASFDLRGEHAVIIGHGNVALDVCRILVSPVGQLMKTDIAESALDVLRRSRLRTVSLIGRRGPAQAKFTAAEMKAFGAIDDLDIEIRGLEAGLNATSLSEVAHPASANARKVVDMLRGFAARPKNEASKRLVIRFLETPTAILGAGRIERLSLRQNRLAGEPFAQDAQPFGGEYEQSCGLLLHSTGFRGLPLPGLPFDETAGVIANIAGRVAANGRVLPGLYVAGWIKRRATGTIGTNRADSDATVDAILADREALVERRLAPRDELIGALRRRTEVVDFAGWLRIDAAEVRRGLLLGKPREKFSSIAEMLACARMQEADAPHETHAAAT